MLFWILIAAIVLIPTLVAIAFRDDYDCAETVMGTIGMTALISFFIFIFASLIGGAQEGNVLTQEKTYTIAQSNTPTLKNGTLSFVYEENGASKVFEGYVRSDSVSIDKPSKIKISDYDVVNPWIAPWPLNDRSIAEFIK